MRNGEAGIRGGPPGDLYVVIHIKEHEVFEREGEQPFLRSADQLSPPRRSAAKSTCRRSKARRSSKIPAGTQSGTAFKLRGKGMPIAQLRARAATSSCASLVEVPTKLNGEQRKKLEEFAELMGEENSPLHKGFFDKAKEFFR